MKRRKRSEDIRSKKKGRGGSSFEDFLKAEGAYEETSALAIKRVIAWQLESACPSTK